MTAPLPPRIDAAVFEAALIASGKDDAMDPRARERLLASLGVAAAGTVGAAAATKLATAATHSVAPAAKGWLALATLRWVGVGLASSALVGAGATAALHEREEMRGPQALTVAARAATKARALPRIAPPAPADPAPAEPLARQPEAPPEATRAGDTPAPRPALAEAPRAVERPRASSLASELSSLESLRALSHAGRHEEVLAGLDAHDRRFPAGSFREEAVVLRADALVGAGRATDARSLARAWLTEHPRSVHAARLRRFAEAQ